MDSSAGHEHHQEQIGLGAEAATGDTSLDDLTSVPGEGSSTGNVTGERKFARHDFCGLNQTIATTAATGAMDLLSSRRGQY
jgi:hypothetical protein